MERTPLGFRITERELVEPQAQFVGTLTDVVRENLPGTMDIPLGWSDVRVFSWLLPNHLHILDDAEAPGEETVGALAGLLLWGDRVRQRMGLEWTSTRRLREQKALLREKHQRIAERKRNTILAHPFAVTAGGKLVFVNTFGAHEHWHRAFDTALEVEWRKLKRGLRNMLSSDDRWMRAILTLSQLITRAVEMYQKRAAKSFRHELTGVPLGGSPVAAASQLLRRLHEHPDEPLKPFYVIAGAPGADAVRLFGSAIYERQLMPLLSALATKPRAELERWVWPEALSLLLELSRNKRFYLCEGLPGHGHMSHGTLAYVPSDFNPVVHGDAPIGIFIAIRVGLHHVNDPSQLLRSALHELSHLIDQGDPDRPAGENTPEQHQPGVHDADFYRAFQYVVNTAIDLKLSIGTTLRQNNDPKDYAGHVANLRNLHRNEQTPALTFDEAVEWAATSRLPPRGMKRLRDESDMEDNGEDADADVDEDADAFVFARYLSDAICPTVYA
jgi:hypothetical protein